MNRSALLSAATLFVATTPSFEAHADVPASMASSADAPSPGAPSEGAPAPGTEDAHELPPADATPKPQRYLGPSRYGVLVGLNGGLVVPAAGALGAATGVGGGAGVCGSFRFLRHFTAGLAVDGMFFVPGGASETRNVSAFGGFLTGGALSHPDGVGAYGQLGLGFRVFAVGSNLGGSGAYTSFEATLAAGLHLKIGDVRLVVPRAELLAGTASGPVQGHLLLSFGLAAYYEHDLEPQRKHAAD